MSESESESERNVDIAVELSGDYDEVVGILRGEEGPAYPALSRVVEDFTAILETVERLDGATRSQVAENLPESVSVDFDGEGVVTVLQVLQRYDLVSLEGNTWSPGPAL
ncbi:MAG: hypothetical protein ABEJ70_01270 [Halobacteriaceae archaeon]